MRIFISFSNGCFGFFNNNSEAIYMHGALFCIIDAPSWKKKIYAIIIYTYITYTYSYGTSMNLMTFVFFYLLRYDI